MRGAAVSLFPKRAAGSKKGDVLSFRPRLDQERYIREAMGGGYSLGEVMAKLLDLSISLETELGETMRHVRAAAEMDGVSPGVVVGRLVKRHEAELKLKKP